ncbi:hypothetical protein JHK86_018792 [Glycine max]|nr:hypothetical protein JHK86_018792 [Glycine max]
MVTEVKPQKTPPVIFSDEDCQGVCPHEEDSVIISAILMGHVIVTFLDAILSKTLCGTLALLAGRGCGKSATLGLSIAGAIVVGYYAFQT